MERGVEKRHPRTRPESWVVSQGGEFLGNVVGRWVSSDGCGPGVGTSNVRVKDMEECSESVSRVSQYYVRDKNSDRGG